MGKIIQRPSSLNASGLMVDSRSSTLSRIAPYEDRTFNRDQLEVFGY